MGWSPSLAVRAGSPSGPRGQERPAVSAAPEQRVDGPAPVILPGALRVISIPQNVRVLVAVACERRHAMHVCWLTPEPQRLQKGAMLGKPRHEAGPPKYEAE